jgi:hypothetical protein
VVLFVKIIEASFRRMEKDFAQEERESSKCLFLTALKPFTPRTLYQKSEKLLPRSTEVSRIDVTCTTLGAIYPVARVVFELPGWREFKNTTANRFSIATQEEYVSPIHHRANNSTI